MNLLMIDDDVLMLQDLKEVLNWKELGFDKIYTAENTSMAFKMLAQVPIHVIICDIEMPGENGLDFMETLQNAGSDIPCILLTSYALFEYARRAVNLHVVEYLLKPVSVEPLKRALDSAVRKLEISHQNNTAKKYCQYWLDEEKNTAEYFWSKAATGLLDEVYSLPEKLEYEQTQLFVPVLIECFHDSSAPSLDAPMWEYIIKNVGYELLANEYLTPRGIISLFSGRWLAIVSIVNGPCIEFSPLDDQLEKFQRAAVELLHIEVCFGVGNAVSYQKLYSELTALETSLDGIMNRRGKILHITDNLPRGTMYTQSEMKLWESLLCSKDGNALKKSVHAFLQTKASLLSLENMQEIRQDFAQMIYSFLKQQEIQAHRLFGNVESDQLYRDAVRSIDHMYSYCSHLVDQALHCADISNNSRNAVETVMNYLDNHYSEDIGRSDLSNLVFLSPDHLSRIFKKETGLSLMQYVTKKRICAACDLLKESHMPINKIALLVGYSNFAYFSKIFRETTGMSPVNYRKKAAGTLPDSQ